jgi:SP family facilitated glucose transporter-like MFS transporter 1
MYVMIVLGFQEALGGNVFFVFALLLALFVLFVYKKVPETKNKTMEEITSMFRQQSYQ